MEAAIDAGWALPGVRRRHLGVVTGNEPASRLYESLGFREYGLERASLLLENGRQLDERLLELEL